MTFVAQREAGPGGEWRTGADPVAARGHAWVQTTERYLGTKQDLVHAPNDAIELRAAVWWYFVR